MERFENSRKARRVKREGFNKRELTLFRHSELGSESIPRRKLTVLAGKILKQVQDDSYDNTHNDPITPHPSPLTNVAFTMAEILLSLTIIGVVAAITLPSLTGNINERTWNTQRKALYARVSQAIALMPALNGYGNLKEENIDDTISITEDTATETFITAGLSKVLKINNICANNYADCGITTSYNDMTGHKKTIPTTLFELSNDFQNAHVNMLAISYSTINTKATAFETQNGESIIAYYNRSCIAEYQHSIINSTGTYAAGFPVKNMCVNFIYDLNGKKGPNTFGKDIGAITVFNATDSIVVAPIPSSSTNAKNNEEIGWNEASSICTKEDPETRIPNMYELASLMINHDLTNLSENCCHWSGTTFSGNASRAWHICKNPSASGYWSAGSKTSLEYNVRCIKR